MSVEIKVPTIDGLTLKTKDTYVDKDIVVSVGIPHYDGSANEDVTPNEDAILMRTLVKYRNDRITMLGAGSFMQFPTLKELILPNVTSMNGSCFTGGISFNKLEMPKLETIGIKGFDYVSFPKLKAPLKTIANYGLMGNATLEKLIITQDEVVCKLGGASVFQASTIVTSETMGFVYVPDTLVEEYKVATNWSAIAHKIKPISELEGE